MDAPFNSVEVVSFRHELTLHFESLNREWIEEYFEIEAADFTIFADPFQEIVEPGGQIFFVLLNGKPVGTCAVMRLKDDVFELAKIVRTEAR